MSLLEKQLVYANTKGHTQKRQTMSLSLDIGQTLSSKATFSEFRYMSFRSRVGGLRGMVLMDAYVQTVGIKWSLDRMH